MFFMKLLELYYETFFSLFSEEEEPVIELAQAEAGLAE